MRNSILSLAVLSVVVGCDAGPAEPAESCSGGKCDDPRGGVDDSELEAFPCDAVFANFSTRRNPDGSHIERFVDRLQDPLTQVAFRGERCPTSLADIVAQMSENEECNTVQGDDNGLSTRLVSEESQLESPPFVNYRAVTTKTCGERREADLLFSIVGLSSDSTELPTTGVEVMAFDESTGVYNFYKEVDGKIGFFGSGLDYLFDGHGDSVTDINGCGLCHGGDANKSGRGNLNMKENEQPWLHWEGSFPQNGGEQLIDRFTQTLGTVNGGANLEFLVESGNERITEALIDALIEARDYKRLLGPLFCSEQLNLATASAEEIPGGFLYNEFIHRDTMFVDGLDYELLLAATGSNMAGTSTDIDTEFPFAYISRSSDDELWVRELTSRGIIDFEFATDVYAVDFTRPALSDARCDLLEFAPDRDDIAPTDLNAAAIAAAFVRNLDGQPAGTPAAQLRSHLQATLDGESLDHRGHARSFLAACEALHASGEKISIDIGGGEMRDVSPLALSVFKIRTRNINVVLEFDGELDDIRGSDLRPRPVFEFPRTFASNNIRVTTSAQPDDVLAVHPNAHLHPLDCTLTTTYVPVP